MPKSELYNNSLLPLVLVAAILSGGLWHSGPSGETSRPEDTSGGAEKLDTTSSQTAPWVSDLRPAMESLAAALGDHPTAVDEEVDPDAAGVALEKADGARERQLLESMGQLRRGLDTQSALDATHLTTAASCSRVPDDILRSARVLAASLLVDDGRVKARTAAINALLDEYKDWRFLQRLACFVRWDREAPVHYDVKFIVASVPDYVDSNSGWLADQSLAAIQSGMTRERYLFDRVKLVDWSRSVQGSASVVSGSRLHERQPGIMIFRRVEPEHRTTVQLQVVLLVLETPTAGIHETALRNSLSFLKAWNAYSGVDVGPLQVLGPTFSGSIVSLASVLGEAATTRSFEPRLVITGSANADDNVEQMNALSRGATYLAAVQPTCVLMARMADFLTSMNADWKDGNRVALLTESNTAYGSRASGVGRECSAAKPPFTQAQTFRFPLHIAQLRSDTPALPQPGAALLPNAIVPLNMREPAPPTDLVPALRPQMTSPVVESTIDSIFDAIRHEKLTAVGIVATDDRDVLFLAREMKRASPDVQLFLFGNHALYLHQDYVPYLRGALVASSYSLSLANQPEINDGSSRNAREPFQSMAAEGIIHATQALLSSEEAASRSPGVAYCQDDATAGCLPVAPVSINVIGEDGYWSLPSGATAVTRSTSMPPPVPTWSELPRLPVRAMIVAGLIGAFIIAHLVVLCLIRLDRARKGWPQFIELPLVRVFAPTQMTTVTAGSHRLAVATCIALLALLAIWVTVITLPFLWFDSAGSFLAVQVSALIFGGFVCAAISVFQPSRPAARGAAIETIHPLDQAPESSQQHRLCVFTGWFLFGGLAVTMGSFVGVIFGLIGWSVSPSDQDLTLARLVGGGIVSPAALTVMLFAALYTAVITGTRRLSLVGRGYEQLSRGSRAFDLLIDRSSAPKADAGAVPHFAAFLDMPSRTMPAVYPLAVLLALSLAAIGAWHVSTIEGAAFSLFVRIGSLTALGLGLLLLAQGLATWSLSRSYLKRLAHSPLEPHFAEIAPQVPWDISLAPPRLTEMMPVARMADDLMHDFQTLSAATPTSRGDREIHRQQDGLVLRSDTPRRMGVRDADMIELRPLTAIPSHVRQLRAEMEIRQHASLMQSTTWFSLWRLSDAIVTLLDKTHWQRAGTGLPNGTIKARHRLWFASCEKLVALQMAFVLRDIVARTITFLFAAMLCLTLLTAAHLLYSFNGRGSILTVDLVAVGGAALAAVWILVDMERDHVLSRLKTTTPGKVDINWEFIKRIGIYGVLPLLAVIAALFPEVGGTLFGWLEPLRRLSSL